MTLHTPLRAAALAAILAAGAVTGAAAQTTAADSCTIPIRHWHRQRRLPRPEAWRGKAKACSPVSQA